MQQRIGRLMVIGSFLRMSFLLTIGSQELLADEAGASTKSKGRQYRDGPLTADDFRGTVPTTASGRGSLLAFTTTEIRYNLRYQAAGVRNQWTARVSHADVFAVVIREKSWNLNPTDARLMDHEQGHFDLCQSFALVLRSYFDEQLRSRSPLIGVGNSSAEAIRNLEEKLQNQIKPILDDHTKAQEEYDRVTSHGTNVAAQAEQRKLQQAKVADSDNKSGASKKKSRP